MDSQQARLLVAQLNIIEALRGLTPEEVTDVIHEVNRAVCLSCGYPTGPTGHCPCGRDE